MKKLIVIAIVLMASVCWADMPAEIFKMTNTIDVTSLKPDNPDNDIFGITKSTEEFKQGVEEYFMMKDTYYIVKDWTIAGDSTQCMATTDLNTIYAICIDDKTVVIKKITGVGGLKETKDDSQEELKKCPYCAEMIKKEAIFCRYCRKDLE